MYKKISLSLLIICSSIPLSASSLSAKILSRGTQVGLLAIGYYIGHSIDTEGKIKKAVITTGNHLYTTLYSLINKQSSPEQKQSEYSSKIEHVFSHSHDEQTSCASSTQKLSSQAQNPDYNQEKSNNNDSQN